MYSIYYLKAQKHDPESVLCVLLQLRHQPVEGPAEAVSDPAEPGPAPRRPPPGLPDGRQLSVLRRETVQPAGLWYATLCLEGELPRSLNQSTCLDHYSRLTLTVFLVFFRGQHGGPPAPRPSEGTAGSACPQEPGSGTRTRGDQNLVQLLPAHTLTG